MKRVAIIVACLASFRTLYTRSERRKNSSPLGKPQHLEGASYTHTHNSRGQNATWITSNDDTYELQRPLSSTTSEERIFPLNEVYVRRDFSVLPEPEKAHHSGTAGYEVS